MMTSEYIEYFEDEVKLEIKSEVENLELSQNRKSAEYFEEDVKEENVDNLHSILFTYSCDICSKSYNSKGNLRQHLKSAHQGMKYPCNQCEFKATQQGNLKRHIQTVHEKMD